MISAKAQITNPNDSTLRLTLEMTVGEWKAIMEALPNAWPHWQLARVIQNAVFTTVAHVEQVREDVDV